ncbi:MAG: YajQ family cyclic di-GMP-binding protein [Sphaerobacteraceae bacterium]|nr:MAG: YajQ family cyclic di-GMP-binding protein [Sphaerobacteraceae bacterium]
MASTNSFDIVSDFDQQELTNAVDQTEREVRTRFDLKSTPTEIERNDNEIVITTDTDFTLAAVTDILESRVIRRGLSLKVLDYQKQETASGGKVRQEIKLKRGIPEEIAKQISKQIRSDFKKVTAQIQGDEVRVSSKNKDDLQAVMQAMKESDYPVALQFTNFR